MKYGNSRGVKLDMSINVSSESAVGMAYVVNYKLIYA